MDQQNVAYTYSELLFFPEKEKILTQATMNLEDYGIMLNEISEMQKNNHI